MKNNKQENVIYLVNLDKDRVIPPEEKIISAFTDKFGNSIYKTEDGNLHYKVKSTGETGILGKIKLHEFQDKLAHEYDYNLEKFLVANNLLK